MLNRVQVMRDHTHLVLRRLARVLVVDVCSVWTEDWRNSIQVKDQIYSAVKPTGGASAGKYSKSVNQTGNETGIHEQSFLGSEQRTGTTVSINAVNLSDATLPTGSHPHAFTSNVYRTSCVNPPRGTTVTSTILPCF